MAPSKRWMALSTNDRLSNEYSQGVKNLLTFAFSRLKEGRKVIKCPCVKCCNSSEHTKDIVETHLIVYGILIGYTFWYHHGERPNEPQSNADELDEELLSEGEDVNSDS